MEWKERFSEMSLQAISAYLTWLEQPEEVTRHMLNFLDRFST